MGKLVAGCTLIELAAAPSPLELCSAQVLSTPSGCHASAWLDGIEDDSKVRDSGARHAGAAAGHVGFDDFPGGVVVCSQQQAGEAWNGTVCDWGSSPVPHWTSNV